MHKVLLIELCNITPQSAAAEYGRRGLVDVWYNMVVWERGVVRCLLVKFGIGAGALPLGKNLVPAPVIAECNT